MSQFQIFDISGGMQTATNWQLKQPNEIYDSENIRYDKYLGGGQRRLGYSLFKQFIAKPPLMFFEAKFKSGIKIFYAYNNAGNTATVMSCYDVTTDTSTAVKSDYPASTKLQAVLSNNELYVAGISAAGDRQTVINVNSSLTVSTTRNLIGCPKAQFIGENNGTLYVMNVQMADNTIYPDRVYISSPPKDAVTYVNAALLNTPSPLTATNRQLKVDSARYIKAGMALEIYKAGTTTKLYDVTVVSVDNSKDTFDFTPIETTITNVDAATEIFTIADTTLYPTGTPVTITASTTMPAGLTAGVTYYVIKINATTFKLATTKALALAGTNLLITSAGAGTIKLVMGYELAKTDEIYLSGRYADTVPTILWNVDYRSPQKADFIYITPGKVADPAITGWVQSNNRLNVFTKTSMWQYDNANFIPIFNDIGCINHDTICTNGTYVIWLDATGKVRARDSISGQDQIISRAIKNQYLDNLTLTNLTNASAVMFDSNYKLSVGLMTIGGQSKITRFVYNFDANIWWREKHTRRQALSITSSLSGTNRCYFLDEVGGMYLDEDTNLDGTATIPWFIQYGRRSYGSFSNKTLNGVYVYNDKATGSVMMVKTPGIDSKWQTIGQITGSITPIEIPDSMNIEGADFDFKISGNSRGEAPLIEGIEVWSHVRQAIFA